MDQDHDRIINRIINHSEINNSIKIKHNNNIHNKAENNNVSNKHSESNSTSNIPGLPPLFSNSNKRKLIQNSDHLKNNSASSYYQHPNALQIPQPIKHSGQKLFGGLKLRNAPTFGNITNSVIKQPTPLRWIAEDSTVEATMENVVAHTLCNSELSEEQQVLGALQEFGYSLAEIIRRK